MGFVWFWVWSFIWMWATVNGSHIWDRNNPCHDEDKRLHALAEVSHICRGNNKREQRTVSMFELSWDRRWCLSRVDMGVGASLVLVLLEQPRNRRLCPLCRTPIQQVMEIIRQVGPLVRVEPLPL